jgi:hypothetical protein
MNLETLQTFALLLTNLSWKEAVLACDPNATVAKDADSDGWFEGDWNGTIGKKIIVVSGKGSDDCWRRMKAWCISQLNKGWIPPVLGKASAEQFDVDTRPSKDDSKAAEQKRKDLNKKARDRYHKNRQVGRKNKPVTNADRVRTTRESKAMVQLDGTAFGTVQFDDPYAYLGAVAQLTKKLAAFEKSELVSMLVAVLVKQ